MEIDAICQINQAVEKMINDVTTKVDTTLSVMVAVVQHNSQQSQKSGHQKDTCQKLFFKKKYEFTKSSKPIYDYFKRVGHIHTKCLKRQADEGNRNNQEN